MVSALLSIMDNDQSQRAWHSHHCINAVRPFVCEMLKYRMHKLNLSYDKRATQTAFCFTTRCQTSYERFCWFYCPRIKPLLLKLASGRRRISGRRFSPPQFMNGEKRRLKIRLRSLASKKSVCLQVTKRC